MDIGWTNINKIEEWFRYAHFPSASLSPVAVDPTSSSKGCLWLPLLKWQPQHLQLNILSEILGSSLRWVLHCSPPTGMTSMPLLSSKVEEGWLLIIYIKKVEVSRYLELIPKRASSPTLESEWDQIRSRGLIKEKSHTPTSISNVYYYKNMQYTQIREAAKDRVSGQGFRTGTPK